MITVLYLRLSTEIRYNELITSNIDKILNTAAGMDTNLI